MCYVHITYDSEFLGSFSSNSENPKMEIKTTTKKTFIQATDYNSLQIPPL